MARSLDILGDRWTLLVVRDLLKGKTRFRDLEVSLRRIPTNILADRLKLLEAHGVVERIFYCEHPPRAEYQLTERGADLAYVIAAIAQWGAHHLGDERTLSVTHANCGAAIEPRWVCEACGQDLVSPRIEFVSLRPIEQVS